MPESIDQEIRTLQSIFWSERDPDGLAFAPLADAFRRNGQVREALDLLTDGMSRHPDYATGHVVATRLYMDQGMDSEAELAARRVLDLDPENLVALSALVSVLDRKGEPGEAARHKTALFAADPDSEEARAVADVGPDAGGVDTPRAGAVGTPLQGVAEEVGSEAPEITELVPETMYQEGEDESFLEELTLDADLAGDAEAADEELSDAMATLGLTTDDEVLEVEADSEALPGLERELENLDDLGTADVEEEGQAGELAADPLGLTTLSLDAPDEAEEPVMELADLAPDEPEEPVVELADLAPDEPVEPVVELADLAPDELEEPVVELADLAPDEPVEPVVELADLAPDEPEEPVVELADLAPDAVEEPVMELTDLAPDEPEPVVDLAALAPDASVEELAEEMELAEQEGRDAEDVSTEPVHTRTLADLYIKQGFPDKALEVLKHIQRRQPDAQDLAERIAALEEGDVPEGGFRSAAKGSGVEETRGAEGGIRAEDEPPAPADAPPPPTTASMSEDPAGSSEDEVERRAQELAHPGDEDHHGVDTPFAWGDPADEAAEEADEPIASYLETLLEWENRAES